MNKFINVCLMFIENINVDMFANMPQETLLISYNGDFNMSVIDKLVTSIKETLHKLNIDRRSTKSIYSICVECLENVMRHGKQVPENDPVKGKFSFGFKNNKIYFLIANHISDEDKNKLQSKLENLDQLTVDKIKEVYKHDLIHGTISERGGAGLGMYVMAMKSNKDYQYQFIPQQEHNAYYYSLQVNIDCEEECAA